MPIAMHFLRQHAWHIVLALAFAMAAAVADQFVPRLLQQLMDTLARGEPRQTATLTVLAIAIAYTAAQLLRILQRVALELVATRLASSLVTHGTSALMSNSLAWHMANSVGQVHVRLERSAHAIADLLKIAVGDVIGPLMGVTFSLLLLFQASAVGGAVAAVVATTLAVVTALQVWHQNGVRVAINRAKEALGAQIVDAIANVETVKLCAAEQVETQRVRVTSEALAQREFVHHKAMAWFDVVKAVVDHGGFAAVVGAAFFFSPEATVSGAVFLTAVCYQRLMEPLRSMHRIVDETAERLTLAADYRSLMETIPAPETPRPELPGGQALSLRDVSFTYPQAVHPVLSGVSFDIPIGARVAVVGPSGGGKSTLARLICGLLLPDSGAVLIDGASMQAIERQPAGQRKVAVLPQEVRLFAGSLLDNIRYGHPGASDEDVLRAANAAGVGDLLMDANGKVRCINARGDGVSGGQKQRIGLARVLLRDARVVVLDEPTSAQDPGRKGAFFKLVMRSFTDRTVVVVTHDTSNIGWATHVVTVGSGVASTERMPEHADEPVAIKRLQAARA